MATEQTKLKVKIEVDYGDHYPSQTIAEVERVQSLQHDLAAGDPYALGDELQEIASDAVSRARREIEMAANMAALKAENAAASHSD
jgi:hypothetical protein